MSEADPIRSLEGCEVIGHCDGYEVRRGKLGHAMPLILEHHYSARRTASPVYALFLADGDKALATTVYTAPVNKYFKKGSLELARLVRLPEVETPMSQFVAWTLRWIKKDPRRWRYCLSYADTTVGHHGGIYQALSFHFVRISRGNVMYRHEGTGRLVSGRSFDQHAEDNKSGWTRLRTGKKYLYIRPLHTPWEHLAEEFGWESLPYIKPDEVSL